MVAQALGVLYWNIKLPRKITFNTVEYHALLF